MNKKILKILALILGMGVGEYFLSFPFRFVENWAMGILAEKLQEDWRNVLSFTIIWVAPFFIVCGLVYLGFWLGNNKSRKNLIVETRQGKIEEKRSLSDTLTAMHRRLVELQNEKAMHTKISYWQFEKVMPVLADRMGTVKLKHWPNFVKSIKRRIQQQIPHPKIRRRFSFLEIVKIRERVQLAALHVATEITKEAFESKKWTFEDCIKIGEWLDGYHWGVKDLRDNDGQWNTLFKSISDYLKDTKLRELIDRHIKFSYFYNNICLIRRYSEKYPKTSYSSMLYAAIVNNPISPIDAEIALSEILNDVEKRLQEIQNTSALSIASTKARITANIPASQLTPEVNIERAEYILGSSPTIKVSYRTSSTEFLAHVQREAKLRIQQGQNHEDISPVVIIPYISGIFENTTDYCMPAWLQTGKIIVSAVIPFSDGSEAISKPYELEI